MPCSISAGSWKDWIPSLAFSVSEGSEILCSVFQGLRLFLLLHTPINLGSGPSSMTFDKAHTTKNVVSFLKNVPPSDPPQVMEKKHQCGFCMSGYVVGCICLPAVGNMALEKIPKDVGVAWGYDHSDGLNGAFGTLGGVSKLLPLSPKWEWSRILDTGDHWCFGDHRGKGGEILWELSTIWDSRFGSVPFYWGKAKSGFCALCSWFLHPGWCPEILDAWMDGLIQ